MENLKHILNNRQVKLHNTKGHLVSAVLLPVTVADGELQVLFEVRASHLKRQPGEVCFPGGIVEPDEISRPQETAVRETVEELGIAKDQIELIGPLDLFISPLGALIYPYVGMLSGNINLVPNPDEVEEVFAVPVKYFLSVQPDQSSIEIGTRYAPNFPFYKVPETYKDKANWSVFGSFPVYFYEYGNRLIWGATAGIMYSFINICRENSLIDPSRKY